MLRSVRALVLFAVDSSSVVVVVWFASAMRHPPVLAQKGTDPPGPLDGVHVGDEVVGKGHSRRTLEENAGNVDLRAEMDCVVAISTCPQSGRGEAATVEIYAS